MKKAQEELVEHLQKQFEVNRRALHDLREVTGQLEVLNRKLQESEALKSHFLSNIRNEITNPLTAIMGLSNRLLAGEEPARLPVVARMIYEEAFTLDFQLQNIFAAAELEAGEAAPEWARVDVAGVLAAICSLLEHRIGQKGVRLISSVPATLFFVTDARRLHLMLINLLANAVEFSPPGGEVALRAEAAEGRLRIGISDQGSGIAPADRETVFDRFRQLESGPAKGHRGHGLGLSITRAVAELLGGSLILESTPGGGSHFHVTLPEPGGSADVVAPEGNLFFFEEGQRF